MAHITAKVFPSAGAERVVQKKGAAYDIYLREPARDNRANRRIPAIIAAHFGVPLRAVRIVRGHRTRNKLLEITEQ